MVWCCYAPVRPGDVTQANNTERKGGKRNRMWLLSYKRVDFDSLQSIVYTVNKIDVSPEEHAV